MIFKVTLIWVYPKGVLWNIFNFLCQLMISLGVLAFVDFWLFSRGESSFYLVKLVSPRSWFWHSTLLKSYFYFPPGSKSVALQLGVHLILLYFIRIWSWVRRLFYFGGWLVVDGGWSPTFLLKYFDNSMVYTLGIYVYI